MGIVWLVTLIITAWVFFVLGKKYQDLTDILMARRMVKLIDQRKTVDSWRGQITGALDEHMKNEGVQHK